MKTDKLPPAAMDFLLAARLLTRLPLPRLPDDAFGDAARAAWAYPLVGAVLGIGAVLLASLTMSIGLPDALGAALAIAALALATGAMHEDGLCDCADGFWGGYDKVRRLEIMKDSQIGTFGTLALLWVLGVRWIAYAVLLPVAPAAIVVAAILSRAMMPVVMQSLPRARSDGLAYQVGIPGLSIVMVGLGLSGGLSLLLIGMGALAAILAGIGAAFATRALAQRKVGGQTGDVLGATQQLCEIAILCTLVVVVN